MKEADEKSWIDYCPPHSVDISTYSERQDNGTVKEFIALMINYCPFCGKKLNADGTREAFDMFFAQKNVKELEK